MFDRFSNKNYFSVFWVSSEVCRMYFVPLPGYGGQGLVLRDISCSFYVVIVGDLLLDGLEMEENKENLTNFGALTYLDLIFQKPVNIDEARKVDEDEPHPQ